MRATSSLVTAAFMVAAAVASFAATTALLPPLVDTVEIVTVAAAPVEPVAQKSDEPHMVRTIPIATSEPPAAPPVALPDPPVVEPSPVQPIANIRPRGDVCGRHGGYRVDDAARRSWRCVFPRKAAR